MGKYTVEVTGQVNGVENSFTFVLDLLTPCDRQDFVSISPGSIAPMFIYVIGDYSVTFPFEIDVPDAPVVTNPFQHDLCGTVETTVFFKNTQQIGVDTITPPLEVLNYFEDETEDCIAVKGGFTCTYSYVRTIEIFTSNTDLIGLHSFLVEYRLTDYPQIGSSLSFIVDFQDPCAKLGYGDVNTIPQSNTPIFTYSGSDELYEIAGLFQPSPTFCDVTY